MAQTQGMIHRTRGKLIHEAISTGSLLSWMFIFGLSNVFFHGQGENAPTLATLQSVIAGIACTTTYLLFWKAREAIDPRVYGKTPKVIGALFFMAATLAEIFLPPEPGHMVAGACAGVGFSLYLSSYVRKHAHEKVLYFSAALLLTTTFAVISFALFLLFAPQETMLLWCLAFPAISIISTLSIRTETNPLDRSTTFALSLSGTSLDRIAESKAFLPFVWISGFLLGYNYNLWPQITRVSIDVVHEAWIGPISMGPIAFLITLLMALTAIFAALNQNRHRKTFLYLSLAIIVFAGIFSALPFMENNWALFAFPEAIAALVSLLCLVAGIQALSSNNPKRHIHLAACMLSALTFGLVVAACYCLLIQDAVLAKSVESVIVIGTLAVFFVGLLIAAAALWRDSEYLGKQNHKLPQEPIASPTRARCQSIAEQYRLSPREQEILRYLAQGRNGPFIEEALTLARSTVKTHIRHIYDKTGVTSRQELIDLISLGNAGEGPLTPDDRKSSDTHRL